MSVALCHAVPVSYGEGLPSLQVGGLVWGVNPMKKLSQIMAISSDYEDQPCVEARAFNPSRKEVEVGET